MSCRPLSCDLLKHLCKTLSSVSLWPPCRAAHSQVTCSTHLCKTLSSVSLFHVVLPTLMWTWSNTRAKLYQVSHSCVKPYQVSYYDLHVVPPTLRWLAQTLVWNFTKYLTLTFMSCVLRWLAQTLVWNFTKCLTLSSRAAHSHVTCSNTCVKLYQVSHSCVKPYQVSYYDLHVVPPTLRWLAQTLVWNFTKYLTLTFMSCILRWLAQTLV
jgi:glutathione peroxidase-family protein